MRFKNAYTLILAAGITSVTAIIPHAQDSLYVPRAALLAEGEVIFQNCSVCHGSEGNGSAGSVPPLRHSDFFMAQRLRPISILLNGLDSSITVNGLQYQSTMPSFDFMTNREIASVITYLRVAKNDSSIISCNANILDPDGFALCTKTARNLAEIATDSIAVWEVANIRSGGTPIARGSISFRVDGLVNPYTFQVPHTTSGMRDITLTIRNAQGRAVWGRTVEVKSGNGAQTLTWNGRTSAGQAAAAGMYIATVSARGADGKAVQHVRHGVTLKPGR